MVLPWSTATRVLHVRPESRAHRTSVDPFHAPSGVWIELRARVRSPSLKSSSKPNCFARSRATVVASVGSHWGVSTIRHACMFRIVNTSGGSEMTSSRLPYASTALEGRPANGDSSLFAGWRRSVISDQFRRLSRCERRETSERCGPDEAVECCVLSSREAQPQLEWFRQMFTAPRTDGGIRSMCGRGENRHFNPCWFPTARGFVLRIDAYGYHTVLRSALTCSSGRRI